MKISVIGLGKLGAPLAAVFASKGFDVIGVDLNPSFVDALNAGKAPVDEPRLQELIDAQSRQADGDDERRRGGHRDRRDVRDRADAKRLERPFQQRGRAERDEVDRARAPSQRRLSPRRHHQHRDARIDRRRDPAGAGAAFRAHASARSLASATTRSSSRSAAWCATCCGRT